MEWLFKILSACVPVLVALVGIIPTIISNRKKTEESIKSANAETENRVADVQATLNNHIREDENETARNRRYRILRFYDEMCEKRRHSESHFEDILDDIDAYEKYCHVHPEFKNNRGKVAMEHIKEAYGKVKSKGGFLIHEEEKHDNLEG